MITVIASCLHCLYAGWLEILVHFAIQVEQIKLLEVCCSCQLAMKLEARTYPPTLGVPEKFIPVSFGLRVFCFYCFHTDQGILTKMVC